MSGYLTRVLPFLCATRVSCGKSAGGGEQGGRLLGFIAPVVRPWLTTINLQSIWNAKRRPNKDSHCPKLEPALGWIPGGCGTNFLRTIHERNRCLHESQSGSSDDGRVADSFGELPGSALDSVGFRQYEPAHAPSIAFQEHSAVQRIRSNCCSCGGTHSRMCP